MPYEVLTYKPLACYEEGSLTVGAAAVGLPESVFVGAKGGQIEVLLSVEGDAIRLALSGAAAGSASMAYGIGDKIRLAGIGNCRNLSMIRVENDATVRYQAFRKVI